MYKEIVEVIAASFAVGSLAYGTAMYLTLSREYREKSKLTVLKDIILHPIRSRNEIEGLEVKLSIEE